MARILSTPVKLTSEFLEEVRQCTSQDGILAVATESSYAFAASAYSRIAVARVAALKGRSSDKPLLVLIGERSQLDSLVLSIPSWAVPLLDHFWPGPLTCIFPARSDFPAPLISRSGTIGVRCPGDHQLRSILHATGPLTGTSANRTASPPLLNAQDILAEFGNDIDLILDSGISPGSLPSTILILVESPRILRHGTIASQDIQAILARQGVALADTVDA